MLYFCVEVPINKPVAKFIFIEEHKQIIEYEGDKILCKKCGSLGHALGQCSIILTPLSQVENNKERAVQHQGPQSSDKSRNEDDWHTVSFQKLRRSDRRISKTGKESGINVKIFSASTGKYINTQKLKFVNKDPNSLSSRKGNMLHIRMANSTNALMEGKTADFQLKNRFSKLCNEHTILDSNPPKKNSLLLNNNLDMQQSSGTLDTSFTTKSDNTSTKPINLIPNISSRNNNPSNLTSNPINTRIISSNDMTNKNKNTTNSNPHLSTKSLLNEQMEESMRYVAKPCHAKSSPKSSSISLTLTITDCMHVDAIIPYSSIEQQEEIQTYSNPSSPKTSEHGKPSTTTKSTSKQSNNLCSTAIATKTITHCLG
ncbi:PREDICTED: uncharacterized protein DDB_G0288805-like [Nicotiana attenuata]|uniref:uncharacterized protein DDB_G0288805-like n=1 Tax=Nicotiana attenuata TaxID=49451 RepID=UPI000904715F|nr:PREDICTED: uncharacterized protein DDB_G0288805-like [Nicotiana attenuata]